MTKLFIFLFTFLTLHFSFAQKKQEVIHITSKNDFNTTVNLLYQTLEEKELTVFADFDHQHNAKEVGLTMPRSRVIVFGNPKVGTFLMKENPSVALELPLKIAIVEDENAEVSVVFTSISSWKKKYNIKDKNLLSKIQAAIDAIAKRITHQN
ncbi:DUF302 domain-containing protein [Bergeyella zoohelcum]|uniref:Uncharacterized conserved protein n=1 Tax=Bergeyella zoohelcum TaxID=1015 RepID=A0A7Z9CGP6_9FLAO|nr:DUF302 domain-containing protein [Bergeyella zoohelcum]VDH05316.1 Uncharacterized conserved protein [Bergeyella zoohelcum]